MYTTSKINVYFFFKEKKKQNYRITHYEPFLFQPIFKISFCVNVFKKKKKTDSKTYVHIINIQENWKMCRLWIIEWWQLRQVATVCELSLWKTQEERKRNLEASFAIAIRLYSFWLDRIYRFREWVSERTFTATATVPELYCVSLSLQSGAAVRLSISRQQATFSSSDIPACEIQFPFLLSAVRVPLCCVRSIATAKKRAISDRW